MSSEPTATRPKPPGTGRRARRPGRLLRRLALALIPLSILGVTGLLILTVVSYRVAARFEAREHETPTRIYGRAVPLRPGAHLPEAELAARLRRLGYRQTRGAPSAPGEYRGGSAPIVHLRSFETAQGTLPARAVRLHYGDERISWLEDPASGDAIDEVLLEPEVIATLYGEHQEDRTVLPLQEFPRHLVDAVLVTEDRHFHSHPGIDPFGVARAAVTNVGKGAIKQGGSTLTQQLAKNLFFEQERTWSRKAAEAIVALVIEARYSKERILQAYLNEIYLGQRGAVSIRGFAQASAFYFGKDVRFLDLSESATLAGLIRAPGVYNPFVHPARAVERRDQVLAALEEDGKITKAQRLAAQAVKLKVRKEADGKGPLRAAPYLADYVRQMLVEQAGASGSADLSRAGLSVDTTVDPVLQRHAEEALTRGLTALEGTYRKLRRREGQPKLQGAIVVLDPRDGSVLAMVGGRDYASSQFNRITQAKRQPGSLFKPFVYLAGYEEAVDAGWGAEIFTPATPLMDEPLEMQVAGKLWAPENYDHEYRGDVTAQMALEQSLNVPTVRAAQAIGLKSVVSVARRAGIKSPLKRYPSLALGAQEVTPLEIASAYATIANGGVHSDPVLVETIRDARGSALYRTERASERTLTAQAAYLVTVALQGAMDRGTAASSRALGFTGTAAGKTGTTNEYRDTWFAGYTPDLLALVWVGFDAGDSTNLTGAQAALPIWVDFMKRAGAETSDSFPEPRGIRWEQVDLASGMVARWSCPDSRYVAFLDGTEPTERCSHHGLGSWWSRRDSSE